jgi:N-acetylmuramoyl-L-alanine amidase
VGATAAVSAAVALSLAACGASAAPPAGTAAAPTTTTAAVAPTTTTAQSPPPRPARPLAGKVVGIDPGHNGGNFADPGFIDSPVWNGRESEACDTTGTETDGGYTEALFNFRVASYLASQLRALGARVVMTRHSNHGVGPCITNRARIINRARADVAIDVHADGGPAGGRGFAILEPVADGPNDGVIGSSRRFARVLRGRYGAITGMPTSDYDGSGGLALRDDLAGLNLTTVPKVLIECGNMRNSADARRLVSARFQRLAARSFSAAIVAFLRKPN